MTTENLFLLQSELLERGWTKAMIQRLLGEPDERRPSPHGRQAPPLRLYSVARVQSVESSEDFRQAKAKAAARSARARENVERRRDILARKLAGDRTDVFPLFRRIAGLMWSPETESQLDQELYRELPVMLWDALAPKPEHVSAACEIIGHTTWAILKERTYRPANPDAQSFEERWAEREQPLALTVWEKGITFASPNGPPLYANILAASVRHFYFSTTGGNKFELRKKAFAKLDEISTRSWLHLIES